MKASGSGSGPMNLIENNNLRWKHFTGGDEFDYPIDYWSTLLQAYDDGHVDLLYRWEPNSYCHFHRHTARTTSTILAGELHVIDIDFATGEELGTRIRGVGDYACKEPGDVHMEKGGPDGALVLFNLYAADGLLAETLSKDRSIIGVSKLKHILRGNAFRSGIS